MTREQLRRWIRFGGPEAMQEQELRVHAHFAALPELTWSCHFCGDVRPDQAIGVVSRVESKGLYALKHNRRYCADRRECMVEAMVWQADE